MLGVTAARQAMLPAGLIGGNCVVCLILKHLHTGVKTRRGVIGVGDAGRQAGCGEIALRDSSKA